MLPYFPHHLKLFLLHLSRLKEEQKQIKYFKTNPHLILTKVNSVSLQECINACAHYMHAVDSFPFVCSYHKRGLIPAIKLALYHALFSIYFLAYINSIYSCPCFKIISSLRWRPVNL